MASLTPGVLSKLIENAGDKGFRATGEHRFPLLQVLEIVPSLPGAGDDQDDPWRSRGFFLKVSDSLHSAYASISDEDLDLIYSDKIQLGQFVYVSRLDSSDSGSRVPILRGLKPVPKRRPCVGNPKDLVSSDALPIGRGVGFSKPKQKPKPSKNAQKSQGPTQPSRTESRRLSLDSARKGWDQCSSPPVNGAKFSSFSKLNTNHTASPVKSEKKAAPVNSSAIKPPFSRTSPLKNNKVTGEDVKLQMEEATKTRLIQRPLDMKTGSEKKISWSALPSKISAVGKRTVRTRNTATMAAVHALEEAAATEGVIYCMCVFAELSESSHIASAGVMAEKFLELYQRIQKAQTTLNFLLKKTPPESSSDANSWVQAAVATNLSKFKLFKAEDNCGTEGFGTHLHVVVENTMKGLDFETDSCKQTTPSSAKCRTRPAESSTRQLPSSPLEGSFPARKEECPKREEWSKGSGLEDAAKLAEELLSVSRQWFVKYLENLLSNGFELKSRMVGSEIGHLLRQLKRVNQWMDELIINGVEVGDRIEQLKKKLYRFLLEHVDIASHSNQ